jgi:hypothetical protein
MARIKPFRAIRPNPLYADQLVFTKPQTESVAGDKMKPGALPPLKILLETAARQRPETIQGQERSYQDIRDGFLIQNWEVISNKDIDSLAARP